MLGLLSRSRFSNGGRLSGMAPKFNDAGDLLVAGGAGAVTLASLQAAINGQSLTGIVDLTASRSIRIPFDFIGPVDGGFYTGAAGSELRMFINNVTAFLTVAGTKHLALDSAGGTVFIRSLAVADQGIQFITGGTLRLFITTAGGLVATSSLQLQSNNNGLYIGAGDNARFWFDATDFRIQLTTVGKLKLVTVDSGVTVPVFAGDPANLENGAFWYNSATNKFRGRAAGVSVDLH